MKRVDKSILVLISYGLLRLVVAVLILHDLLFFACISFLLDAFDHPVFVVLGLRAKKVSLVTYERYDKFLDLVQYTTMFLAATNLEIWPILVPLYLWRALGNILFLLTNNRKLFLFTPNVFEYFTLIYLILLRLGIDLVQEQVALGLLLVVLFLVKLVQEYLCHFRKLYLFAPFYKLLDKRY
jgi:hypothetical protein